MALKTQTSSLTTAQASDEVDEVVGEPVPVAGEGLLSLEPQAVDRRETARVSAIPAGARLKALPARRT